MRGTLLVLAHLCFLSALFSFCNTDRKDKINSQKITEAKKLMQAGDILLRSGTSYASDQIRELSLTDRSFSHAGIVVNVENGLQVCSIEPIDDTSPTDSIRYEAIETFLDPAHNSSMAIYRYNLSDAERTAMLAFIQKYYTKQVVFDPVFQYETDDKMYCSELISKAVDSATLGRISLRRSYITNRSHINSLIRHFRKHKLTEEQILKRQVVLIDNVYQHPQCRLIKKFEFGQ